MKYLTDVRGTAQNCASRRNGLPAKFQPKSTLSPLLEAPVAREVEDYGDEASVPADGEMAWRANRRDSVPMLLTREATAACRAGFMRYSRRPSQTGVIGRQTANATFS